MTTINLKDEVQQIIGGQWQAFAQEHPRLAEVIDQTLLVEQATASLADDAAFQQAMRDADAATISGQSLLDLVQQYVIEWLKKLIG